jgi:hypothetical protein
VGSAVPFEPRAIVCETDDQIGSGKQSTRHCRRDSDYSWKSAIIRFREIDNDRIRLNNGADDEQLVVEAVWLRGFNPTSVVRLVSLLV